MEVDAHTMSLWKSGFERLEKLKARSEFRHDQNHCWSHRAVQAILKELRNLKTVHALVDKYYKDNKWCLKTVHKVVPKHAPAFVRSLALVEDSAYYLRYRALNVLRKSDREER